MKRCLPYLISIVFATLICRAAVNNLLFHHEAYEFPSPPSNVDETAIFDAITAKPLSYLGMGSQCLAFTSDDCPYVFKLCKASRYQIPSFMENALFSYFFENYAEKKKAEKRKKREQDFFSYYIANEAIQNQSGVVLLHLNKKRTINKKIRLKIPSGLSFSFKMDDLVFYIQKKATPLQNHLLSLLQKNDTQEIQLFFYALFQMVLEDCKLGLQVKDICPKKNIGVFQEKPMWIDPGRIVKNNSLTSKDKQKKALENFQNELAPLLSSLSKELETLSQATLTEILGEI